MMTVPVRYYCPRCGTIATLQRDAYLADKSVTPYPLEGWRYVTPDEPFEDADGVRLTCGERTPDDDSTVDDDAGAEAPCGEAFYLNFVRFEDGEEVEATPESERVRLGVGPRADGPRAPDASPASRSGTAPRAPPDDREGS
jgi:hypothetical protein